MHKSTSSLAIGLALFLTACGGGTSTPQTPDERGARVYNTYCATCHQADGSGLPRLYPPVRQTEWVEGDPGRLIRLVLYGMRGPIEVKGEQYNGLMPPHRHLSDDQIADVITFIRSNLENDASEVTADDVFAVRREEGVRGAWTPDELATATGIPSIVAD